MNGEYTWLSIGVYRWKGIAKAMNTSSRVISGEYLQGLHVQQTIIKIRGSPGESDNEILMLDLAKFI